MPPHEPRLEHRDEELYVAIVATVTMSGIAAAVDRSFPALFAWLTARGIEPAGPPFIRYLKVDMEGDLELEFGVPIGAPAAPDGQVRAGTLPGGRYVTLLHVGPYSELIAANATVQEWGQRHGLRWQMADDARWSGRLERYLTDPAGEPDSSRWETEVAYLVADD